MLILGVHIGHDSSAALIKDGNIIAAAAEERFTRIKHYSNTPYEAIKYCLKQAGIVSSELDIVAFSSSSRLHFFLPVKDRNVPINSMITNIKTSPFNLGLG